MTPAVVMSLWPVSYTHLDVYKRQVQDLCKTYGTGETEVHALNHVSFSVRKGEFIAIIGESGSGKSTLLNVIGALDSATSGKVWICLLYTSDDFNEEDLLTHYQEKTAMRA